MNKHLAAMPLPLAQFFARYLAEVRRLLYGNPISTTSTGPTLEEFTFNLNSRLLVMSFNDVIDVFTTETSAFVLINEPSD